MADRTFWYGRVDPGYGRYRYELKLPGRIDLSDEHDLQDLAELAADDYFGNHDGWEASWPIMFAIASTEDGPELARFRVELESQPVFNAMRIAGVSASGSHPLPAQANDGGENGKSNAQALVDEQAQDDGLWFTAQTAPEAYLQAALRRLHAAVEGTRSATLREPFIVKHYADTERPIIKGNGFDGLEIGADRDEAEAFVRWINAALGVLASRSEPTPPRGNDGGEHG